MYLFLLDHWTFTLPCPSPFSLTTPLPFRFHLTDLAGDLSVLSVYNIAGGEGSIGDGPDSSGMTITKDGKPETLETLEGYTLQESLPTATPPMTPQPPLVPSTIAATCSLFTTPSPLPAAPTTLGNFWSAIGSMFTPHVTNKPGVISAVSTVLSLSGVTHDRGRVRRALRAIDQGNMDAKTWAWVLNNLKSKRGLQELRTTKQLTFDGPRWSQPRYKSARGITRLLGAVITRAPYFLGSKEVWFLETSRDFVSPVPHEMA